MIEESKKKIDRNRLNDRKER